MARRIDRAPQPTHSAPPHRRRTRSSAARRLAAPVQVPQPRDSIADDTRSEHPIMHWVLVTDENGRTHPEVRWL